VCVYTYTHTQYIYTYSGFNSVCMAKMQLMNYNSLTSRAKLTGVCLWANHRSGRGVAHEY